MSALRSDALGASLYREFKLESASVFNKHHLLNSLADEQHLLSAIFEINGRICQVMIDTGATISCIPENGEIMKHARKRLEQANLQIKLADGSSTYVDKKVRLSTRPAGSNTKPFLIPFYVQNNSSDIFGFQALIGLRHLKLFQLDITMNDGKVSIYHQNQLIGNESPTLSSISATVKVVDNISSRASDNEVQTILKRYKRVFSELDDNPIVGKPMRIITVHQRPIFAKQRHYSFDEIIEIKDHVESLLKKNIIEPSNSGYAANSRIIRKKNGQGRLVINYIPLNAVTYRDSYVLPNISDILLAIQGKKYFSSLDCAQGFYQIEVDKSDRHKLAFSTPIGNFQFRRCPFGARNSCAEFQAAMNRIFREGLFSRCVIYVDDILVFGDTLDEHNRNLEWVLQRCAQSNVKLKIEKCNFLQTEVEYLGFLVSGSTVRPVPSKVSKLLSIKAPRDKTELRSIIGKLNFYSRFIPNYSRGLECLRSLLVKDKDFQWRPSHQQALDTLVSQLDQVNVQTLVPHKDRKVVVLSVFHDSLEALLLTEDSRLITRTSRLLSTNEANYSFIEKQLLCLVLALTKFRILMQPGRFTIRAPNKDLDKIIKQVHRPDRVENLLLKLPPGSDDFEIQVDESLPTNSAKKRQYHVPEEIFYVDGACRNNGKDNCRASWAVCAEYDRELELKGYLDQSPSNQSAEIEAAVQACRIAKSRGLKSISIVTDSKYLYSAATLWIDKWRNNDWKDHKNKPVINVKKFEELLNAKQDLDIEWCHVKGHSENVGNNRADILARSLLDQKAATLCALSSNSGLVQDDDPEINDIKNLIMRGSLPDMENIDNTVYFIDKKLPEGSQHRVYVPKKARHWLLTLAHDDEMYGGHLGVRKTFRKLTRFYWPRMHSEVESYVKSCDTCQKFKSPSGMPPGYLHSIPVSQVFEHLHIDIVGPLRTTIKGHKYIITATDAFSKWAFAVPSQNVRTQELISFVEEYVFAIHGKPKRIITDRGTQFTSKEWQTFISKSGIEHKLTTPYHPQSNGIDERLNGTLMRMLRNYVDEFHEKWDEHLKWSLYSYNTTVHESTGYSPYQILYGLDPRSPLKPPIPSSKTDNPLKMTKEDIRTDVNERNKFSQDLQKRYYDRHRRKCELFVGQLVYIKVNNHPTFLTSKFHIKWDGPMVIIQLLGDTSDPKAVKVLDYENMTKKVVSINDVKPMIDTYDRPSDQSDQNQKDDGHTLIDYSCDSQIYNDASYHVNLDSDSPEHSACKQTNTQAMVQHSSDRTIMDHHDNNLSEQDLNLQSRTLHGPLSSSPRRVTISDTVTAHLYPPESPVTETNDLATVPEPQSTNQVPINPHVIELQPSTPSSTDNQSTHNGSENQSTEMSTQLISFHASREPILYDRDDVRKDPAYVPPPNVVKQLREDSRSSTTSLSSKLPVRSQDIPYNFRPNTASQRLNKYGGVNRNVTMRRLMSRSPRLKTVDTKLSASRVESSTDTTQTNNANDSTNDETAGLLVDFNEDEDLIQF